MRRWVVVILFAALVAVPATAARFLESPRADVESAEAAVVRWVVSPPVSSRVLYGPFGTFPQTGSLEVTGPAPVVASSVLRADVRLEGLLSGTRYAFQVILIDGEAEERSAVGEFTTPSSAPVSLGASPATATEKASPPSNLWEWFSRLPLSAPEEPIVLASLTFLTLFMVLLFVTVHY